MKAICKHFGVPACLRGVVYVKDGMIERKGTIIGSYGMCLLVTVDGECWSRVVHPVEDVRYTPYRKTRIGRLIRRVLRMEEKACRCWHTGRQKADWQTPVRNCYGHLYQ